METSLAHGDTTGGEMADVAFHRAIVEASGNPLFLQLIDSLYDRFEATIKQTRELWFYRENATAGRLLQEHRSIFDAIEKQDGRRASELVGVHLDKVIDVLRTVLS